MANGAQQQMGGFFSSPNVDQARQARRERLFSNFVNTARSGGGGATLGAGIGTLIQGLFGGTPGVDRATRMRSARQEINRLGGIQALAQSDEAVKKAQQILAQRGLQQEAARLPLEVQQYRLNEAKMQGEPPQRTITARGGTPLAQRLSQQFGVNIPKGETYEIQFQGNNVTDVNRLGSGQTINVGGEPSPFQGARTKALAKEFDRVYQQRSSASDTQQLVSGLSDLVVQRDVKTGAIQPAVKGLQNISQSLGIDLGQMADQVGLDLGNLSKKEEFNRLAQRLTINQFDKFKGNLNDREDQIAQGSVPQLGTSKKGNIRALASLRAAAELAERRANRKLSAQTEKEFQAVNRAIEESGTEEFKALRDQYMNQMEQMAQPPKGGRKNPYEPTTQQEYNQIPSGSFFVDDEGLKRKP